MERKNPTNAKAVFERSKISAAAAAVAAILYVPPNRVADTIIVCRKENKPPTLRRTKKKKSQHADMRQLYNEKRTQKKSLPTAQQKGFVSASWTLSSKSHSLVLFPDDDETTARISLHLGRPNQRPSTRTFAPVSNLNSCRVQASSRSKGPETNQSDS